MPAMASITVKKFDGTTDIVFDALAASGGDNSPAYWRQDTGAAAGLPVGLRSLVSLQSTWNGPKTARQMRAKLVLPYAVQDSTTTIYSAKDRVVYDVIGTFPIAIPSANLNEAAYQGLNVLGSLLFRQAFAAGFSPT